MAQSTENLVNSQYVWEISTDGTVYNTVGYLQEMDMPQNAKAIDEVTPTDAKSTINVVADFTEVSEMSFTLGYMPTDAQHTVLKSAYEANTVVKSRIRFLDAPTEGYQFDSMVKEFVLKPEMKKMLRVEGVLVITSEITDVTV